MVVDQPVIVAKAVSGPLNMPMASRDFVCRFRLPSSCSLVRTVCLCIITWVQIQSVPLNSILTVSPEAAASLNVLLAESVPPEGVGTWLNGLGEPAESDPTVIGESVVVAAPETVP